MPFPNPAIPLYGAWTQKSEAAADLETRLGNIVKYNAKDYGAIADGASHPLSGFYATLAAAQAVYPHATSLTQEIDWAAVQAAVNGALPTKAIAYCPAGTYTFGSSGLTLAMGSQLQGDTGYQYTAGFGVDPKGTRFNFTPTLANSDFITFSAVGRQAGFAFHISLSGFYLFGNSVLAGGTNSRYGINVDQVIYSRFENIAVDGFQYAIRGSGTIQNRFVNMTLTGTVACVIYAGNAPETTDVWWHCSFLGPPSGVGCPIGVQFIGSTENVRFFGCLWEQISNYGIEVAKDCANIEVHGGYCEDVPFANNANGCMFRVGYTGGIKVVQNHLTVIGGRWKGRNAGFVGNLLDCDDSNGVMLSEINVGGWTSVIRTTANTRINSVVVQGASGISYTTFATDFTKVSGVYPSAVIGVVGQSQNARLNSVGALSVDLSAAAGGQIIFPVTQNPSGAAQTLDDYQRGSWTPSIGGTATYTTQVGRFIKIGNMVFVMGRIVINALGTGSTSAISGLPFASSANPGATLAVGFFSALAINQIFLAGLVNASASTMTFSSIAASGAAMTIGPAIIGAGTEIRFSGWYEAAT